MVTSTVLSLLQIRVNLLIVRSNPDNVLMKVILIVIVPMKSVLFHLRGKIMSVVKTIPLHPNSMATIGVHRCHVGILY